MNVPYDSFDYPCFWETRHFEDKCEKIALKKLFRIADERGSIVDIGGGFGRLSTSYAHLFESCTILEPSEKLIEIGREKFKDLPNLSFKKGSLPHLPFESSSFDMALMIRVIHHLADPLPAFIEVNRILKKEGYFVLEVANKIHFLERIKAYLRGDFSFARDLSPREKRSRKSIEEKKIIFLNHHPRRIKEDLLKAGFVVIKTLSVSNFRSPFIKKIVPEKLLLNFEKRLQGPLGNFLFGPSIFILARKR